VPSKLNIFTEVAIGAGHHEEIVGHLEDIAAQINILISGIRVFVSVELDISLSAFGSILFGLIQVRHCFKY
jgi:hypothetical protein